MTLINSVHDVLFDLKRRLTATKFKQFFGKKKETFNLRDLKDEDGIFTFDYSKRGEYIYYLKPFKMLKIWFCLVSALRILIKYMGSNQDQLKLKEKTDCKSTDCILDGNSKKSNKTKLEINVKNV